MIRRYGLPALAGAAATLTVLTIMMALVTREMKDLKHVELARIVDFVRLKRSSEPEVKKRELPSRAQPERPPPPPQMDMADAPPPGNLALAAAMPMADGALELAGGPSMGEGGAASDADAVPLVRVSAQYPPRAMQRGIEGWVHLRFTVTRAGTVSDPVVVKADPVNYFESAAMTAVKKYRYKPKVENGKPVERPGVELVMAFRLDR